jgi:hypothetical protein
VGLKLQSKLSLQHYEVADFLRTCVNHTVNEDKDARPRHGWPAAGEKNTIYLVKNKQYFLSLAGIEPAPSTARLVAAEAVTSH